MVPKFVHGVDTRIETAWAVMFPPWVQPPATYLRAGCRDIYRGHQVLAYNIISKASRELHAERNQMDGSRNRDLT